MYFNPHEREARDASKWQKLLRLQILIHTSVKLVTGYCYFFEPKVRILIHTSVKLVTTAISSPEKCCKYFNPHEREARDHGLITDKPAIFILIHTSVKLVTKINLLKLSNLIF